MNKLSIPVETVVIATTVVNELVDTLSYNRYNPVAILLNKHKVLVEYLTATIRFSNHSVYTLTADTPYDDIVYMQENIHSVTTLTLETPSSDEDLILTNSDIRALNGINLLPYEQIAQMYCIDLAHRKLYDDTLREVCISNPLYPSDIVNLLDRKEIDITPRLSKSLTTSINARVNRLLVNILEGVHIGLDKVHTQYPLSITRVTMLKYSMIIDVYPDTRIIRYERMLHAISRTEIDSGVGENLFCN